MGGQRGISPPLLRCETASSPLAGKAGAWIWKDRGILDPWRFTVRCRGDGDYLLSLLSRNLGEASIAFGGGSDPYPTVESPDAEADAL